MALKHTLETLDGLSEEMAKNYVKKDGKFVLDVEDSGFKAALKAERDRADAAEKAVKDREAKEAADKADAERKQMEAKGEYDKLRAQDQADKEKLQKDIAERDARIEENLKESAAVAALGAAGLKVNRLLLAELKGSLEVVQGKVVVKGDPSLSPDQKLAKLKEDPELAGLFPASGNGGGTLPPGGGNTPDAKTRFDELNKKASEKPLTQSEAMEVMRLGDQIQNATKP